MRYDTFTVVIVFNMGQRVVGIVVDGVSDVVTLTAEQLHPAPVFTVSIVGDYVLALGCLDERMLILLDIEKFAASGNMGLTADTDYLNENSNE